MNHPHLNPSPAQKLERPQTNPTHTLNRRFTTSQSPPSRRNPNFSSQINQSRTIHQTLASQNPVTQHPIEASKQRSEKIADGAAAGESEL